MSSSRKFTDYFKDMRKVLELAEKPEGDEFKNIFRMIILGFVIVGAFSFGIVYLVTWILNVFGAGLR
ncbi:MAG: preprotein translocase subunit SecE [Desulfurococcaceae archaeon]|nr:preprotein translocase subunit SecE [Desulfurococcaceae archaeon]